MAEAGTGVGKSFAYLLPAVHFALENSEKVVISTATITLQQQLYEKDIPLVASAISAKVKAVLMKGRGNYLCQRRLSDALKEPQFDEFADKEIKKIGEWAQKTKTGEKSQLSFMPSDPVWSLLCSEADLCLGLHCPFRENCFVFNLRKEAMDAHIIVVNHHLLFADLAARYQGAGYENAVVLPPFKRLVIDEAHTMEKAATSFFSEDFSQSGISRCLSRLLVKKRANMRGLLVRLCAMLPPDIDPIDNLAEAMKKIREAAEDLDFLAAQICGTEGIFRLSSSSDESFLKSSLFPQLTALRKNILSFAGMTRKITENLKEEDANEAFVWEIKTIIKRLEKTAELCDIFREYKKHEDDVLWLEKNRLSSVLFTRTPLDLAPKLKESVFLPNKTVVCVSATLAINSDFTYWASQCGINLIDSRPVLSGCCPSPFPYSDAVLLASPSDAPSPDEEGWQEYVDGAVGSLVSIAGGSALLLFTSYKSLDSAYKASNQSLASLGIRCLKQGDDDRSRLLQDFISDKSSCLFATDSFWEGVDAPGDTLRLVIICRLPFRTPGDPVLEARREALQRNGGNPFMELSLPQAVTKFKQGFGRLMRRSADCGVVAVLDNRLLKKNYGQLFLQSLPETRTSFNNLEKILRDMESFFY
jgi:ATP-dependent DNA helicase DinG